MSAAPKSEAGSEAGVAHTPTPWTGAEYFRTGEPSHATIGAETDDGFRQVAAIIANGRTTETDKRRVPREVLTDEDVANARIMQTAVNSHAALVAALAESQAFLAVLSGIWKVRAENGDIHPDALKNLAECVEHSRAALALAEGKP